MTANTRSPLSISISNRENNGHDSDSKLDRTTRRGLASNSFALSLIFYYLFSSLSLVNNSYLCNLQILDTIEWTTCFFFLILSLRNELLNGGIILLEFMGEEEFVETCLIWKSRVNILLLIFCRKFVVDFKFRIWGKIFKLYES